MFDVESNQIINIAKVEKKKEKKKRMKSEVMIAVIWL